MAISTYPFLCPFQHQKSRLGTQMSKSRQSQELIRDMQTQCQSEITEIKTEDSLFLFTCCLLSNRQNVCKVEKKITTAMIHSLRDTLSISPLDGSDISSHPRTLHLMFNNYKRCTAATHSVQSARSLV